MSTISPTLSMMAYRLSASSTSAGEGDGDFGRFPQIESSTSQDSHVSKTEKFDFRNMSSNQLQSLMPDIIAAAHLTMDEQMELGTGFIRNALTKVNPNLPDDLSAQSQDILTGLQSYIQGDLSRGDIRGAQSLKIISEKLNSAQEDSK